MTEDWRLKIINFPGSDSVFKMHWRLKTEDWRQKTEDWRLKTDDRRQRTEGWRQKTEDWRLKTLDWRLKTEDWRLKTEDWRRKTEDWRQKAPLQRKRRHSLQPSVVGFWFYSFLWLHFPDWLTPGKINDLQSSVFSLQSSVFSLQPSVFGSSDIEFTYFFDCIFHTDSLPG